MIELSKIFENVVKKMKEDEGVAGTMPVPADNPPTNGPDIEKTGEKDLDITANYKPGMGTKEVLGKFDPNAGIMTPDDNYLPAGKKKKIEKRATLLPNDMIVIEDDAGEVERSDKTAKGKK